MTIVTGPEEFGDPCRQCGYGWGHSPDQLERIHSALHEKIAAITAEEYARSAHDREWSVGEYVCHIGDNDRIWAERFAGITASRSTIEIAPYDQDELARARHYWLINHASAMWLAHRASSASPLPQAVLGPQAIR